MRDISTTVRLLKILENKLKLLKDHEPLTTNLHEPLAKTSRQAFNFSVRGIKELAPFCFESRPHLVRVPPNTRQHKLAPKYLADIIKNNDTLCFAHNIYSMYYFLSFYNSQSAPLPLETCSL